MSELNAILEALSELDSIPRPELIRALMDAHRQLASAKKTVGEHQGNLDHYANRADLFARRCEIALQILRDDENGFTMQRLEDIAAVIWPEPVEGLNLQTPTRLAPLPASEHTRASELLWRAHWFLVAVKDMRINLGELLTQQLERWKTDCDRWRVDTGVDKLERDEIRDHTKGISP